MKLKPLAQHSDAMAREAARTAVVGRFAVDVAANEYLGELVLTNRALPGPAPDYRAVVIPFGPPEPDAQTSRARILRRDSGALRTVLNILSKWDVAGERAARLLGTPKRTVYQWAKNVADGGTLKEPLGPDTLDRLSYILGVWKAAMIVLPNEAAAIKFLRSPNTSPVFAGRAPLDRMLDGRIMDLAAVRAQFDGWRGG